MDEIAKPEVKKLQVPGTVPVTLGVKGMYNIVPIDQGLRAFKAAMDKREDQSIPTDFLLKIMRFVASSNFFVFDRKLFLQLLGVAMGSRSSPTFACIFMGMVELLMLFQWHEVGGLDPKMWKRFIDDIFFWQGLESDLLRFINHINSCHYHKILIPARRIIQFYNPLN